MSARAVPIAKFRLGRIVATSHALGVLTLDDVLAGISRHQAGDWGEVSPEDHQANDLALVCGTRVLSTYTSAKGVKFWVITEADRRTTTVLLPEEY